MCGIKKIIFVPMYKGVSLNTLNKLKMIRSLKNPKYLIQTKNGNLTLIPIE